MEISFSFYYKLYSAILAKCCCIQSVTPVTVYLCISLFIFCFFNLTHPDPSLGKKPRTKAPKIQRLVTPRVLQHKRRRIALKRQRTQKNKDEAAEYAKMLAKRLKVRD